MLSLSSPSLYKAWARKALISCAPRTATRVLSARARAYSQQLVRGWGLSVLNERLMAEVGASVVAGPFRGLVLTPMTREEHVGPYLLGTYELELHPWLDRLSRQSFTQILDVGAKFGYYAVGLARCLPDTQIVAFDTDWWARDAVREMAATNGTPNVSVESFCDPAWLKTHLRDGAFVISDCEGYEGELFTADIPQLATATLLIETHDDFVPGVHAALVARFQATHRIEDVRSRLETPRPDVTVRSLSDQELARVSQEVRPDQSWLLLVPRKAA
jgi:hypothetical protein